MVLLVQDIYNFDFKSTFGNTLRYTFLGECFEFEKY